MKSNVLLSIILCCTFFMAIPGFAQDVDPGSGIKISETGNYPVWSPDGKWIAMNDTSDNLALIPSEGGDSVSIYNIETVKDANGNEYTLGLLGKPAFSSDSKELFFTYQFIDEERGTLVETWKPSSTAGYEISNEIPIIKAVNIYTGELRVVLEEALCPQFSHDGKYFAYVNYDHRSITDPENAEHHHDIALYDSETDTTQYFPTGTYGKVEHFCFSADDSYIVAAAKNEAQDYTLLKIPVNGDDIEELINFDDGYSCFRPECSPDGLWVLFSTITEIVAYNTETGVLTNVFPETGVISSSITLSP